MNKNLINFPLFNDSYMNSLKSIKQLKLSSNKKELQFLLVFYKSINLFSTTINQNRRKVNCNSIYLISKNSILFKNKIFSI